MHEKQLIINVNPTETRLALLEQGDMSEIFIERCNEQGLVGNIYKGIVTRVLPGMNSAFVDIGLDKSAFLFGGDVLDAQKSESSLSLEDHKKIEKRPIEVLVKDGQEIVVQISKEPLGTKGPRVTTYLTIPGRYLVLMPNFSHIGISRRIEDEAERQRLKDIVEDLIPGESGLIVRTAAVGIEENLLRRDIEDLLQSWKRLEKAISASKPPSFLYKDIDIIHKVTRDLYSNDIREIVVDDQDSYIQLGNFLQECIPEAREKLVYYQEKTPIFDVYGIEIDIGRALNNRVELPSGGYLIIEQTEALTSFDVNTGKFVGKVNAQQTILSTNIEAAKKIVEQLRIRNIGGIIILDFIDMESLVDREQVYNILLESLRCDRARTNVLKISDLGLVQMTRKRTSESLERRLLETCPHCEGRGYVKSTETEANELMREIMRFHALTGSHKFKVKVRKEIEKWIEEKSRKFFETMASEHGIDITIENAQLNRKLLREASFEVWNTEEL